jgi:beta-aspartyl-peptidase (threonine type)
MKPAANGWVLAIHGGAGEIETARIEEVLLGCRRAVQAGAEVLAAAGSALDAVEMAVRALEDDPAFNAGFGSVLTREGTVEVDAAVMTGEDLRAGAVGALPDVRHPVSVARRLLDTGEHVLLVGAGAAAFAREQGFSPEPAEALVTDRARERLARWLAERSRPAPGEPGGSTVGAVARDQSGRVAAATSTGGMTGKRPGRVGDSPLVGAGTYACSLDGRGGACSATGHGEAILRALLAYDAVERLRQGVAAGEAARAAMVELVRRIGTSARAGLIVCDVDGAVGLAHNSSHMPFAIARAGRAEVESGVVAP